MKNMFGKFVRNIVLLAAFFCISCAYAVNVPESLDYKVMFKWGLINKQAGRVNLSTYKTSTPTFRAELTAASEPWADNFYKVRDTLRGVISPVNMEPDFYEKISHEGGTYKHDKIRYTKEGAKVTAHCERLYAKKEGSTPEVSTAEHVAEGFYLDMLSAFYYMRSLNYEQMKPGESVKMNIFSGKRLETLTITYRGKEDVELDKKSHSAYHITFSFTGKGGKTTSDGMDAWISTASAHIPLKLKGKLPVGSVVCLYTGSIK